QAEQLRKRPEVLAVEEDKTYSIQVFEGDYYAGKENNRKTHLNDLNDLNDLNNLNHPKLIEEIIEIREPIESKHNVLRGRRHFRRHPVKRIRKKQAGMSISSWFSPFKA